MKRSKTFVWIILPIMLLAGCRAAATPAAFLGTITNTPTNTPTVKPESTATPTKTEASATPRLLGGILYSAALDASKIKNIVALPCQDDVTPVIPSDSKENYNPVVFVLPAAEGGYEKIHVLGGMYKGKGVGIADFLIDNKDFAKEIVKAWGMELEEAEAYLHNAPLRQALIKSNAEFSFYSFGGQRQEKNIRMASPVPSMAELDAVYRWDGVLGLSADSARLKAGLASDIKHNPFPRGITYLESAAEEYPHNYCDFEIDLNNDGVKEKILFTLQKENEFLPEAGREELPVACIRLVTESGQYILAASRFVGSWALEEGEEAGTEAIKDKMARYAKMDVLPIDVDGDGQMELMVYSADPYGIGGGVTIYQLRPDGLHELAHNSIAPID